MVLYSPLCGNCVFDRINMGTIICRKQNTQEITFTSNGYYMLPIFDNCECMIFPSKDQRDWSKFVPPLWFNDGDIVATDTGDRIGITTGGKSKCFIPTYCVIKSKGEFEAYLDRKKTWTFDRFATTWEKEKLFNAIKDNGYKWNANTKTLEKLTPKKLDISALKPFDKVLVRDHLTQIWTADLFSFYDKDRACPYVCVGHYTTQCVPYEGNEHLLGTTNECAEYYKNW